MSELTYKRILLKVSGEALGEKTERGEGFGLNFKKTYAEILKLWLSIWLSYYKIGEDKKEGED